MADRYCSNCGQELGEESRFCPNCGRPLAETASISTPEADTNAPIPPTSTQQSSTQQSEAPQRKWRTLAVAVAVVALILLIGGLVSSGGEDDVASSEGNSGGQAEGEQEPSGDSGSGDQQQSDGQEDSGSSGSSADDPVPFGETAQNGDLRWTITDAEQTDEIGDEFDSMSGNFVVVDFQVENTGDQSATIDYEYLLLQDSEGRETEPSVDASMYVPMELDPFYEDISPGVSSEFRTVYEVAPDAEGLLLEATSENFDEGYSYLSLGI
jgi:hypothetical protein